MDVTVLHDEPLFAVAARDNLVVALWREAPTVANVVTLRETTWPYADDWPDAGFINLIVSGTPSFSDDVRRELAELSKREDIYQLGTAHIVALDGLRGAATRAFLSTLFILSRPKTPTKVFADEAGAGEWLAPKLGRDWTPEMIVEVCRYCRERLGLGPTDAPR